jgi:hypothetical protein
MARATNETVAAVIQTDPAIDLLRPITTAHALTNYVASKDSQGLLNGGLLTEIEIYLAAHFYALRDPQYQSKSTDAASATFQGQTGKRLDLTWWGQQAIALDITGTLASINEGSPTPSIVWLGKPVSQQIPYIDRD